MSRWALAVFILIASVLLTTPPEAFAQGAPFCRPGQTPQFVLGFASLKAQLGSVMGEPVECEHPNNANGDTLQKTSTGLAYWRKSTNTPTFTDGYRHWAITSSGLVSWVGASPDPPSLAVPQPPPTPTPPATSVESFVQTVSRQIDQFWSDAFREIGVRYTSPQVRWIARGAPAPACGGQMMQGPGYCTANRSMLLPAAFFEQLWQGDGDAAVALVLAHEWGHHVQRLLGLFNGAYFTIQTELQADCFAGTFFNYANQAGWLDPGDLDEALALSWKAGDPDVVAWFDPGAHGSSEQRVAAFRRGFLGRQSCGLYTS